MRGVLLIVLPVLLASCHTGYDPNWERVTTPSGQRGFVLECSRTTECIQLAGELCPYGYGIISTGAEQQYDPADQQRENASAALMKRWPANMGKSVRYATIECARRDSPSLPPKITVTKNAPPAPPQKATALEPGF